MRLTTILRNGEARPALVLVNEANRCQWCVDLAAVRDVLAGAGRPWGIEPLPTSIRLLIEAGPKALDNLRRLQDRVRDALRRGEIKTLGDAVLRPEQTRWLPPIPDVPLFITFHGNNIGMFRDNPRIRPEGYAVRRAPVCRLHPVTATLGHLEPLIFPRRERLSYGNELGVVIGPGGKHIASEDAPHHVWGVTNCDDVTRSGAWDTKHFRPSAGGDAASSASTASTGQPATQTPAPPFSRHESDASHRLGRASDVSSPFGPWITTIDEVPDVHDLLMYAWGPDAGYSRSHTYSYFMGPKIAVTYLSRFMTLPAGSVLQLGASGVDGVGRFSDVAPIHGQNVEVDMEHVGVLSNPLWCEDMAPEERRSDEAFYGLVTRMRGIDLAQAMQTDPQPFPHGTRSVWGVRFNDRETAKQPEFGPDHQRHFEHYPATTLSSGEAVVLPIHGDTVDVTCELAAVIGPRQVGRVRASDVPEYLAGYTIMIGFRDHGLIEELSDPAREEILGATIFGRWADGFNAASRNLVSIETAPDISNAEMSLRIDDVGDLSWRTSDYLLGLSEVIAFISREITLLPGDVVTLGAAGPPLTIPAGRRLAAGVYARARIEGLGEFSVPIDDQRGPHPPLSQVY